MNMMYQNPRLSVRRIGIQLGLSKYYVWEILKKNALHPYHFKRVQNILEVDGPAQSVFCAWILNKITEIPLFLRKILWTDEAKFTRARITNYRNLHIWAAENPPGLPPVVSLLTG